MAEESACSQERTLALPEAVEHWPPTASLEKLIKIGAKVVADSYAEMVIGHQMGHGRQWPREPSSRKSQVGPQKFFNGLRYVRGHTLKYADTPF